MFKPDEFKMRRDAFGINGPEAYQLLVDSIETPAGLDILLGKKPGGQTVLRLTARDDRTRRREHFAASSLMGRPVRHTARNPRMDGAIVPTSGTAHCGGLA